MTAEVAPAGVEHPFRIGGLVVLTLGALDFGLEQTLVLPALPALTDHYGATVTGTSWLITGFLLTSVVGIPLLSRLGDMFGKRRMVLVSLGAFASGSFVCAVADSIGPAIAGRALQGVGAAVGPLTYALARDMYPPQVLPRAIGAVIGAASVGSAMGYVLSGLLVDHLSAVSVFWLLFALPVVLAVAVVAFVPESIVRARVPIDIPGAVVLGSALAAILLGISRSADWGRTSAATIGAVALGAVLLASFMVVELRSRRPLVDPRLVLTRPFAQAHACAVALGFSFFIATFLTPVIAATPTASGYGSGLDALHVGLVLFPTGIATLLGAWLGGRAVDRVGPRALVAAGSALAACGYVSLAVAHDSPVRLAVGSAVVGLAAGPVLTAIAAVVVRSAGTDVTGVAASVNAVFRNTSVSVGAQIAFAIVASAGVVGGFPDDSAYEQAFSLGAGGAGLTFASAVLLPGRTRPVA
jgi:MFS family permease